MRTILLLATALVVAGVALSLAGVADARPVLPCVIGHSYYSGCLVCEAPPGDTCACAPECAPP